MRRFYKQIVVGLLLAVVVSGTAATNVNAVAASAPVLQPVTQLSEITLDKDLGCRTDKEGLDVTTSDVAGFDLPTGIDINPDAIITNYVICPLLDVVYGAVGLMLNLLEDTGILEVQPLLSNGSPTEATKGLYAAWSVFRDLANFGLIAGLFLVVFSQATSYGLSAYGVRKMLPKIVIAALLINMSYIICAVLVDVFNILGSSLDATLLTAIENRVGVDSPGEIINDAVDAAGAGGTAIQLIMSFTMLMVLGLLLLVGLVCIFFLIARQILIIVLIMFSPLAFIAWLFPNTESSFRKWWSTLIRLLAIYPVVMCLNVVVIVMLIAMSTLILR